MSHRPLLFGLLGSVETLVISVSALGAQAPSAAVVSVRKDSLELMLSRPSYVVVAEIRPQERPRILFPHVEDEWKPLAAGPAQLALTRSLASLPSTPDRELSHCLVGPTTLTQWSPADSRHSSATRSACGALSTMTQSAGGTGPWEAWAAPRYNPGPDTGYLVIIALDGAESAVSPNAAVASLDQGQSPVAVARLLGGLSWRYNDPGAWQGTIVRLR